MNQRERFKRSMRFEKVDRVPFWDYGYWEETIDVWKREALPREVTDIEDFFGLETWITAPVNIDMCPSFEPEVIEENERSRVIRDPGGVLLRESKVGSSIPQFIDFPVKCRRDWEQLKGRFDASTRGRYPSDWDDQVKIMNAGDKPVFLPIAGYFGFLRQLMGLEGLSYLLYDDPQLILDIQEHMTELRMTVLARALKDVEFDAAAAWEDMSCNKGPLISPAMYRRFMLPFYKQMTKFVADHGIDIVIVDSDGNINELVDLFIESGITANLPLEVRSDNDALAIREKYPTFGIVGGIDKRALMKGKSEIDAELEKLKVLLPKGGFIPTVDHRVPPDVPYENYVYYLLQKWRLIHDKRTYGKK